MGYTTYFNGGVAVVPPFTPELVAEINTFADADHRSDPSGFGAPASDERGVQYPGIWCQWVVTFDGSQIVWDEGEKFYDSPAWMVYVIDRWVKPTGRTANGIITAEGEDSDDIWRLVVKDNEVITQQAEIKFPDLP